MTTMAATGAYTEPGHRHSPVTIAAAVALAGAALAIASGAHGPDFAAQVARAQAAQQGVWLWWSGWYGGVEVAPYSLLSGPLMRMLGAGGAGVLACALISVAAAKLLEAGRRRRAAAAAASVMAVVDLFSGRVTYALGLAAALWALVALRSRRRVIACALAAAASLLSPLAALALGTIAVALPGRFAGWRWRAAVVGASALPVLATAVLFPGHSIMPFRVSDLALAAPSWIWLYATCRNQVVRRSLLIVAATWAFALVIPSGLGVNATRLLMLAGPACFLAAAQTKRAMTVVGLIVVSAWPAYNICSDLHWASGPSVRPQFYAELLPHLPTRTSAGFTRVEVVDPASHGAEQFLSGQRLLARGWERQVDVADNPLFYDGTLNAVTYRRWLDRLAVGYVALPHTTLDWGSTSEAALIASRPAYLHRTWANADWTVYAVSQPTSMVSGPATITSITATGVGLTASAPGTVVVRMSYSKLLRLHDAAGMGVAPIGQTADGQVSLTVPGAGRYLLST